MQAMVLITSGKTINLTTDLITTTTLVIKNLFMKISTLHGHLIRNSSNMKHHISIITTNLITLIQHHLTMETSTMLLHSTTRLLTIQNSILLLTTNSLTKTSIMPLQPTTKQLTIQKLSILITLLIQHLLTSVITMLTSKEISIMPLHSIMKLLTILNSILLLITNSLTKTSTTLHQYITHQQLISCIMTSMLLCLIWKLLINMLQTSTMLITSLLLSQLIMNYSTLLQSSTTSTMLLPMLHHIMNNNLLLHFNMQISLTHTHLVIFMLVTPTTSVPTKLQQTTMLTLILRLPLQSTLQLQTTGTDNLTMVFSTTTVSMKTISQ